MDEAAVDSYSTSCLAHPSTNLFTSLNKQTIIGSWMSPDSGQWDRLCQLRAALLHTFHHNQDSRLGGSSGLSLIKRALSGRQHAIRQLEGNNYHLGWLFPITALEYQLPPSQKST